MKQTITLTLAIAALGRFMAAHPNLFMSIKIEKKGQPKNQASGRIGHANARMVGGLYPVP